MTSGRSVGDLAVMEPSPVTTTMHLPKKALRWGDLKFSIEIWLPLSVPMIRPVPSPMNTIWSSAQGQRLPSLSTTSAVIKVVFLPL